MDRFTTSSEPPTGNPSLPVEQALQQWFGSQNNDVEQTRSPQTKPDPHFQYDAKPLQDLRGSVQWKPGSKIKSGTAANEQITNDYQHLNEQMQKYFAGDPKGPKLPPLTDFAGMAKFGSRLAGDQIRNLENLEKGAAGDPKALTDAMRNMAKPEIVEQGIKMGASTLQRNASNEGALTLISPAAAGGKVASETAADTVRTMGKMRDILVEGNTTIHDSAGRAYDAFLKGESSGKGGMESLEKAGYYSGSKEDPMGMYTQGFSQYKQAREIGLKAQQEKDPSKRAALLSQREDLVKNANIKLFIHEQKSLEKPHLYGDKDMKNAVQSIGGSMSLQDPNGKYDLLPKGGDWTDFNSRMGFKDVSQGTPGAIDVRNPDGSQSHYAVDPTAAGTVSHYSNSRTAGPNSAKLNSSKPAPLQEPPVTSTGRGVDSIGQSLKDKNVAGATGALNSIPQRLASDALTQGGGLLMDSATGDATRSLQKFARNAKNRPGLGDDFARLQAVNGLVLAGGKAGLAEGAKALGGVTDKLADGQQRLVERALDLGSLFR